MDAVRVRVKDKRILALVKSFLKAGILTEDGPHPDTRTGTPQAASSSPGIFNFFPYSEHLYYSCGSFRPG